MTVQNPLHARTCCRALHKPLDRQGPGSTEATERVMDFIDGLASMERVLDLGCGTGAQTMLLADSIPGIIMDIDLYSDFTDALNAQAEKRGWEAA